MRPIARPPGSRTVIEKGCGIRAVCSTIVAGGLIGHLVHRVDLPVAEMPERGAFVEQLLDRDVGHRHDQVHRRIVLSQLSDERLALGLVTGVADDDPHHRLQPQRLGDELLRRCGEECERPPELVRRSLHELSVPGQQLSSLLALEEQHPAEHDRPHGMQPELE